MTNSIKMQIVDSFQDLLEDSWGNGFCSVLIIFKKCFTAIMAQITKHLKHFLTISQFHDSIDLLGEVIDVDFVDFDDTFMA